MIEQAKGQRPKAKGRALGARPGQSFIEAMIAITIIVTSITSSLALVQSSITAARIGGSQVVAANLAREGVEVARSLRDGNWLAGRSFETGLVDAAGKTARPILDLSKGEWTLSFAPTSLTSQNAAVYLSREGVYVQADVAPPGAAATPYARVMTLDDICRDTASGAERIAGGADGCLGSEMRVGLAVSSSVRWSTGVGTPRTITVEERLYDWR